MRDADRCGSSNAPEGIRDKVKRTLIPLREPTQLDCPKRRASERLHGRLRAHMAPCRAQPQGVEGGTKIFLSDTQGGTLIIATALHMTRQVIWFSIQGKSQVSQAST